MDFETQLEKVDKYFMSRKIYKSSVNVKFTIHKKPTTQKLI